MQRGRTFRHLDARTENVYQKMLAQWRILGGLQHLEFQHHFQVE